MQTITLAMSVDDIIGKVQDAVWGWPLIILILAAGVWLTVADMNTMLSADGLWMVSWANWPELGTAGSSRTVTGSGPATSRVL